MLRKLVCWITIAIVPASVARADQSPAMLEGKGTVWLNGSVLPHSSAIFPGDLVQTKPESVADINAPGTSVVVQPDSLLTFGDNLVSLEHGTVSVATSKAMTARVLEVSVTPVSSGWTEFEVTDVNGTVEVVARKGDVNLVCGSDTSILSEGQQATRDESGKCSKKRRKAGAFPPTGGDILTNPYALGGLAAGGGLLCLLLCGTSTPSASPSKP
jgi:hypothetical protein